MSDKSTLGRDTGAVLLLPGVSGPADGIPGHTRLPKDCQNERIQVAVNLADNSHHLEASSKFMQGSVALAEPVK